MLAEYVLGCDGANSLVRAVDRRTMRDLKFDQRWLVVDVATRREPRPVGGRAPGLRPGPGRDLHAHRADTATAGSSGSAAGETADDYRDIARLHPLIAPWTGNLPVDRLEIVRVAEYTFRAQLADRWRDRRIFLLGDAAHLTPPFIGQGMGAGLRDAANLTWKLAGVLVRRAARDRPGHLPGRTQAARPRLIRLAKLVGAVMTAGGELGNLLRRVLAPRMHLLPGVRDHILNSETPTLHRSALVQRPPRRRSLAGRLCPNAPLGDGRRFDDARRRPVRARHDRRAGHHPARRGGAARRRRCHGR